MKRRVLLLITILMLGGMCMGLFGCFHKNKLPETGTCGEGLIWEYNSRTKTLTVSGTGDMDAEKFFWKEYDIRKLVLNEGITSISADAFAWQKGLGGELKLPSTLKKIGEFAFYSCQFTGDLIIPDGVERIEDYTFRDCKGFDGILHLPASCKYIGVEAFNNCENFTGGLEIPDGVEEIGRVAFGGCKGLTGDLYIPDSVKKMGDYCFTECTGFDGRLHLSNNLKEIEMSTFSMCKNLVGDLIIPDGVIKIGPQAFVSCTGFDGIISIPDSVAEIGYYAFCHCDNLIGTVRLPAKLKAIPESCFSGCKKLTGLEMNEGLEYISREAFYDMESLEGQPVFPSTVKVIGKGAFGYCEKLSGNLCLPDSLIELEDDAFRHDIGFDGTLTMPSTLLRIGDDAFEECRFKGELHFPEGLSSIGRKTFSKCSGITAVYFGNAIDSIGAGAFSGCEQLKSAVFGDSIADYYEAEEGNPATSSEKAIPGFPGECRITFNPGAVKKAETWKKARISIETQAKDATSSVNDAIAKEEPWYWTNSLTDSYYGTGRYADCEIVFGDGTIQLKINGRDFSSSRFYADKDSEERVIGTDNLCCKSGKIVNLKLEDINGIGGTHLISGNILFDDGSKETVYFHNDSAEAVYMFLSEVH